MRSIVLASVVGGLLALSLLVLGPRDASPPPHCCEAHTAGRSTVPATAPALDGASLYQIESAFTDQDGQPLALASLRGQPVLVAMFYGSCTTVCPMILAQLARIEQALPAADRASVRVVLVTFDPERDTAERLRAIAAERALPTPRWTLLRGDDDGVRDLAMALGVQYRRVADGSYVHSALVTLLDREGRIASQLDGVDAPIDAMVARLAELVASPS